MSEEGRRNRVKDKVVMVVGAGSILPGWGNGKAAAVVYAREGAKVFAIDHRLDAAEETKAFIEAEGGVCEAFAADVVDPEQVDGAVKACLDAFGRIDVLHNNVGGSGKGTRLMDIELDDWRATLDRNVTSALVTCKAVVPVMEKQGGGAIVNISSVAGIRHIGVPTTAYSAGKGALNELTKNIALQYADKNIRANCVLPGLMNTPFIHRPIDGVPSYKRKGFETPEEYHAARGEVIPMKRMGDGWDVAYASLFLASDEASYITGQMLVVDGGLTSTSPGA